MLDTIFYYVLMKNKKVKHSGKQTKNNQLSFPLSKGDYFSFEIHHVKVFL